MLFLLELQKKLGRACISMFLFFFIISWFLALLTVKALIYDSSISWKVSAIMKLPHWMLNFYNYSYNEGIFFNFIVSVLHNRNAKPVILFLVYNARRKKNGHLKGCKTPDKKEYLKVICQKWQVFSKEWYYVLKKKFI